MDPITAFSLAGTIATFIDFGAKFAKLTWSIYHDEGSSSSPALELSDLAESFEQAVASIKIPSNLQVNDSEDSLGQLAIECRDFSTGIVERLRKKGLLNQQPNSKKAAFIHAIRLTFHKDDLNALRRELEGLRDRFSFHLLVSLRSLAQQNLKVQNEVAKELKLWSQKHSEVSNSMQLIVSDLTSKSRGIEGLTHGSRDNFKDNLILRILQDDGLPQASAACGIVLSEEIRESIETSLLNSLIYPGMHDRQEQVLTSFETTFDWALDKVPKPDQKWAHLPTWLVSQNQVYWVSGKAGSGKSTFMKYLSQRPEGQSTYRCRPFLSSWAEQRELVIASFYFWAANPERLQKSREGLFRTLLYQILSAKPTLIPQTFSKQWEVMAMVDQGSHSWSESELRAALLRAISGLPASNCCICLFIDGLDEFEGSPGILIDLVQALTSQGEHVKLCLSSRPWVEFGDAFRQKPQLLLEDLTYSDIKFFVTKKLDDHPAFGNLKACEPHFAGQLVENIVSKGQGVFLWVALVVASLISGISFGDRVRDLQHRLDLLPPDLESLYEQLINGLDPFYHEHRAQLMMLIGTAQELLPASVLYYADGGTIETLQQLPNTSLTDNAWLQQVDTIRRRLDSRWRGLLELSRGTRPRISSGKPSDPSPKVQYLHRTVSDFMRGPKMKTFIQQHIGADFDPNFQLCIGYTAYILSDSSSPAHANKWIHVTPCLRYAKKVDKHNETDMGHTIDQLHVNLHPEHDRSIVRYDMFCSAISEDVAVYLLPKLENLPLTNSALYLFLETALDSSTINVDIVRIILGRVPRESDDWLEFVQRILVYEPKIRNSGHSEARIFIKELQSTTKKQGIVPSRNSSPPSKSSRRSALSANKPIYQPSYPKNIGIVDTDIVKRDLKRDLSLESLPTQISVIPNVRSSDRHARSQMKAKGKQHNTTTSKTTPQTKPSFKERCWKAINSVVNSIKKT